MSTLRTDTLQTTDSSFTINVEDIPSGVYSGRPLPSKLGDVVSVLDYPNATAAVAANPDGGIIFVPNNITPTYPATFGSIAFEVNGKSIPSNVYSESDNVAVSRKLFKSADQTNHVGKEGYTLAIETRPYGSTDGTVPGSDFGLGVSAVKHNWTTSTIEGQVCGVNTVTRGGYFKSVAVITGISKAANAVVTTATAHGYSTGDAVSVQNILGMTEMNVSRRYTITGVTTNTLSLNVDSTAFSTYTGGGIIHLDAGVSGFYNPGDTASYISNTVQSSANAFAAILEGASYYAPSGQFINGTKGIRVQMGAIKHTENIGIGCLVVAENGGLGAAFQAQNVRTSPAGVGTWSEFLNYTTDLGGGFFKAFAVNQLGNIVLHGGPTASTPTKLIRANSVTGALEVVNHAGSSVLFTLSDTGSVNLVSGGAYAINNQQVVGPRIGGYSVTGTISRGSFNATSATLPQCSAFLGALITDLLAHGLIGA